MTGSARRASKLNGFLVSVRKDVGRGGGIPLQISQVEAEDVAGTASLKCSVIFRIR